MSFYKKIFNNITKPQPIRSAIFASGAMYCAGWLVSERNFPRAALFFAIAVLELGFMIHELRSEKTKNKNPEPTP